MPNNLGLSGGALASFGGQQGIRRPKQPGFATAGIATAGSSLVPRPRPPARVNPGLAGIGGSLLGAALGGGKNSGPGAMATTRAPEGGSGSQFNIGLVPADELAKAQAQGTYDTNTSEYRQALNNAAMRYGDPSIMQGLGLGTTVNPNSVLAQAALKAQLQQQQAGNARENAGTFFSYLHDQDLSNIANAQQRAQLGGYQSYQNALGNYTNRMNAALNALNNAVNTANLDERQNAINNLPNASSAAGGFQGGSTNVTGRVPTSAPSGSRGGTPRAGGKTNLKPPPKGGARPTKPGSGRASGVTSNKPKSGTSTVKTGTRRISGGKPRG